MSQAPKLLNDDGTASMATALMMSHHAFRRDLGRFTQALDRLSPTDAERAAALHEEWKNFRGALHGHHQAEDHGIFPGLAAEHREVAPIIEGLRADHQRIDPLLERGDGVFGDLSAKKEEALAISRELLALLTPHLAKEEEHVVPFLRSAKSFPTPGSEAEADMYAKGFSWAMHGIAPEVLEKLDDMLPEALKTRLPAARAEFEARCLRAWGSTKCGSATTPIPNEA
jgi:iron-sulfur cluster repair protein YtfE (RIC family)